MPDQQEKPWTCRFFRDGDEQGILDVLLATFSRWPAAELTVPPIEHLTWKLHSDELALRSHSVVEAQGRIIACHLTISQRVKLGSRILSAYHGVDAAVLPEFQGRGAGADLRRFNAQTRPERFDLYFGMQSGHPAMPSLRRRDWDGLRLERITEILVADAPFSPRGDRRDHMLRQVRQFDHRVDAFVQQAADPFDRITIRSKDELNWRYSDRRAGPFRIVLAEERERLLGHVVYRVSHGRGYIADLLVLPNRLDVVTSLVGHALADLGEADVSEVECWTTPGHPYRPALAGAGFSRLRKTTSMIHKAARAPGEWLRCLEDDQALVHVMVGDTDLI